MPGFIMVNLGKLRQIMISLPGNAAQAVDPVLSVWILERVARYDLNSLMALDIYGINGAVHE